MAPEWNAAARAAWFGVTAAHGRAHLARALLEGNALALRDVIEAIAAAGHAPSQVVCVGGGAKGRLLCELRAAHHRAAGGRARRRRDHRPRRGDAGGGGRGAALRPWRTAGQAMACPRGEPVQPDPELREVYDALHRGTGALRGAAAAVQRRP